MSRTLIFAYGVVGYLIFLVSCVYAVGFVGNIVVPKSIDSGVQAPLGRALLINAFLLSLFAVQHSVMARPAFKSRWTRIIPQPIERSTYVLLSSLLLLLLFWQWRPIPDVVWTVENPAGRTILLALFWIGWSMVILSTFLINHLDFFGLRQVFLHFRGKRYTEIGFKTPALYRYVRHPIMLGFIIAFWATPRMAAGHLVFASASTAYILIALQFEESDLLSAYGEAYREYKQKVSMLIPLPRKKGGPVRKLVR
jgi:protein-S-isoprenylcysteine O-methyltransferase Ste14